MRRRSPSYKSFRLALLAAALAAAFITMWRESINPAQVTTSSRAERPALAGDIYSPFAMIRNGHLRVTAERLVKVGEIEKNHREVRLP